MAIFGKKQDEFEEDEVGLEEGRKITRKLKDLKPENKKKRKEPPKPWGKRERIIVLVVFLATTIISGLLLSGSSFSLGGGDLKIHLPEINLDSLNVFKGETIVIEKK